MVIRYVCGHTDRSGLWKDRLVVRSPVLCWSCERSRALKPTHRTVLIGTHVLILQLTVTHGENDEVRPRPQHESREAPS